jgi:acyl carrier protein
MLNLMHSIESRVLAVVAEKFNARAGTVTPQTDLRRDLAADSLALVEFVMLLESEFHVDIPDEDAEQIATLQQVVDYLRDQSHAMQRPPGASARSIGTST